MVLLFKNSLFLNFKYKHTVDYQVNCLEQIKLNTRLYLKSDCFCHINAGMHARSVLNEHSKYACDLTHLWKSRSQTLGLAHKGGSVVKVWPVTMAISTLHRRSKSNTGSCRLNLQRAMRLTAGSRMTKIHLNAARHAGKPEAASRSDQSAEALMQCDLSEWLQPGSVRRTNQEKMH